MQSAVIPNKKSKHPNNQINPLAPKTPEILLHFRDEIQRRQQFFCQIKLMFIYVCGVVPRDPVVSFQFKPQGNSIWRHFLKKSWKK